MTSERNYASPEAVDKLLEQPQSYGNGYECCKQMIALAKALREARIEIERLREAYAQSLDSLALAEQHSDEFAAEVEKLQANLGKCFGSGPSAYMELAEQITQLRAEISGCGHHHAQAWELPGWAKTRADIDAATDEQLNDVMGVCHVEDGDPFDRCLACYAYEVACKREERAEKGTPKTNKVDDMTPFEALDHVKSLRAGYNACNGALYKNVAVDLVQGFLEECVAKWGARFMLCVERELHEEQFGPQKGDEGRREIEFSSLEQPAEQADD